MAETDMLFGDTTTGVARQMDKAYIGDPTNGLAREIDYIAMGHPTTGLAQIVWKRGERGVFILGFEGSQSIVRTTNIEDQSTYEVIPLSNVIYQSIQEFGDYYVMLWRTSSSRGLYYSTDGRDWKSVDLTSTTTAFYMEQPLVYNGELYIKDYSNGKLYYHRTKDCVTFTKVEATTLPWYGYNIKNLGGNKWAKLTYTTSGNLDYYYVSISNDGGASWVTGSAILTLAHNGSSSWSTGAELIYVDGLLFVCGTFIEYRSTNFMDYTNELVQVDVNTGNLKTRIYYESNSDTAMAYDFAQPANDNLAFRYGIRRESETLRFTYVRRLVKINPDSTSSRKFEEIGTFDTEYYPSQDENGLVTVDCPEKNCYYILMTKNRYVGAGLRNYTLGKVSKNYNVASDCVKLINNDTPSFYGIASAIYKRI